MIESTTFFFQWIIVSTQWPPGNVRIMDMWRLQRRYVQHLKEACELL